jgi:hypothetical protein
MIKPRRMKRYSTFWRELRATFWYENLKVRDHFEDINVGEG